MGGLLAAVPMTDDLNLFSAIDDFDRDPFAQQTNKWRNGDILSPLCLDAGHDRKRLSPHRPDRASSAICLKPSGHRCECLGQ